ncbi:ABC transporter transmembrane domain-containing protein [Propylenella binzhouense]|uniref:ATP-binding cassette domain-containing protein n=1 Tax=Propylenella binzhouense TaxID=2555902 RepID=A0A964T5C5_9HYPH|nr:ABC transporter transmembrane domain-containing protein [Propylenella binzhouense]MYZ48119.1 ATP-binding cassette domain-containing protein [Propylenella binzhouense]
MTSPSGTEAKHGRQALKPLSMLMPYLRRYRLRVAAALAALVAAALVTLAVPLAVRHMIDSGFHSADSGLSVNRSFLLLFGLAACLSLASALRFYLVTTLGDRIVTDIRRDVFAHLMSLSPGFFDTARSGELISRLTADTTQMKSAAGASASIALRNLVLLIGAAAMMVVTSPHLSGLVLMAIPIIVLPIVGFGRSVRRRSRYAQDTLAEATAYAAEAIGAVRIVQAFTQEKAAESRFAGRVDASYEAARTATTARAYLTAFAIFLVFASIVGVLWWGARSVLAGQMSAGTLGQFVLYSVFAAGALGELSQVWGEVSQASGAAERIAELLNTKPQIVAPAEPARLPVPASGEIRFERVSFGYGIEGSPVLRDFDLAVQPGERVAIVGPSGSGKSTVFALLMRYYDPESGRLLVDGIDVRTVDPRDLRRRIALVPQDATIFAASAMDNIRFADPAAGEEAVRAAARAAHADAFLSALPQGYDTVLGERGVTLSGGQRQRVAIARAILKDAPILLLDEATSALDAESEVAVQAALDSLMRSRTTLVIAHRLATIKSVDRIVVMDEGRIVEEGSHATLVSRGGLYARLAELQFQTGPSAAPLRAGERLSAL